LRQAFANALLTLGRLHVEAERYELAVDLYRRAVTHDRYLEEAHRELIRCLAHQSEPALALRQYETLEHILAELDVSPSPETEALVARLRRGERV
jgi:DNA-binding SARP family transcriptional activator